MCICLCAWNLELKFDSVVGNLTAEKDNLCLYGLPDGTWEVALPAEEVPPEMPEPVLGINFARDGMRRGDWVALVAMHTDSWLISVAFYFGARLNQNERCIYFHFKPSRFILDLEFNGSY